MDHHILVLALSEFYLRNGVVPENRYFFNGEMDGISHEFSCECIGQLEVIPKFIETCKKTEITKIIILESSLVKMELGEDVIEKLKKANEIPEDIKSITHSGFFKLRMEKLLRHKVNFKPVDIDERDPGSGFDKLLNVIKSEYNECKNEKGDWKLWLDIHGSFREISMTMFAFMQAISISTPLDLPGADVDDVLRAIPVDGVYSTLYNNTAEKHEIIDRTSFYREFIESPMLEYMNYGQYLLNALEPCEEPPFVFISYKRGVEDKKRFAFLRKLRKSNIRYWYDQGIKYGEEWEKELVTRNEASSAFIALVSEKYFESYQCCKELRIALDNKKPIFLISVNGFMPSKKDYVLESDGRKPVTVYADEIAALIDRNNEVLTEKKGTIDENYTIQDIVVDYIRDWLRGNNASECIE